MAIYSLVFAGLLFTTGALGDRFGRKGALQLGLLIFLCGAGLASSSSSMPELIGCRALMGVGAAFIMPSTLSILINVFPPHERTKAIAIWASVTGAAGGFGPVISGILLAHFWWGSVFLINVPLLFLALIAGYFLVPSSRDPEKAPLDPVGAVLSTIGLVSVVYGLIQAPTNGWGSAETLGAFAVGVVLLIAFGLWERRQDEPMLDISYFRNPAFSTGTGGMILVFMAMYGVMFLITQYFQLVLDYTALSASLRLMPLALIMLIVAPLTPRIITAIGANRTVATGMALVALGLLLFRGLTPHTAYWYVVVAIIPLTTGIAMTMAPMTAAIMSAVPLRRAGSGSAMNDATRELGAALGIAVLGSVAASRYANALHHATDHLTPAQQSAAKGSLAGAQQTAATLRPAADKALTAVSNHAFVDGIHLAVTVGAIMAIIAAGCVLRWLPRQLAHQGEGETATEALEVTAELGLAGGYPITAEELDHDSDELDRDHHDPTGTAELEADPAR